MFRSLGTSSHHQKSMIPSRFVWVFSTAFVAFFFFVLFFVPVSFLTLYPLLQRNFFSFSFVVFFFGSRFFSSFLLFIQFYFHPLFVSSLFIFFLSTLSISVPIEFIQIKCGNTDLMRRSICDPFDSIYFSLSGNYEIIIVKFYVSDVCRL